MLRRASLWLLLTAFLLGFRYRTAEQYYSLYHRHLYSYPEDVVTNIGYLLAARAAPFNNGLHAWAKVETEAQWLYYQKLFRAHVSLQLVEQQLLLASKFDKYHAFFFNRGWAQEILTTIAKAEGGYRSAEGFWQDALSWIAQLGDAPFMQVEGLEAWQDEVARVQSGQLDYQRIINRQLARIAKVRQFFLQEKLEKGTS